MDAVRDHLALALDLDDLDEAVALAERLRPWFGVAKVGLELYSASGPAAVTRLRDAGLRVFVDLKLHDIPTTVERAGRVLGRLGASYVTLHASGGAAMLAAGVRGLDAGAAVGGFPPPVALGVTVLTSDAEATREVIEARVAAAIAAGCRGLVCAAAEVPWVAALAPGLVRVVPGIRPLGADAGDQARAATPTAALTAGADLLVIGRPVTRADDPEAAAAAVADEVATALGVPGSAGASR